MRLAHPVEALEILMTEKSFPRYFGVSRIINLSTTYRISGFRVVPWEHELLPYNALETFSIHVLPPPTAPKVEAQRKGA